MSSLPDTAEKTMSQIFRHSVTDCNANKGARDDTDFRATREALNNKSADCIFCTPGARNVIAENELAFALADTHAHRFAPPRSHLL
jgi:hypothetical protein